MKKLWKDSLTLRENLQRRMPKLARQYFDEGREALAPGTDWTEMHQFRLQTKRFRYTLEIFQGAVRSRNSEAHRVAEAGPDLSRRH